MRKVHCILYPRAVYIIQFTLLCFACSSACELYKWLLIWCLACGLMFVFHLQLLVSCRVYTHNVNLAHLVGYKSVYSHEIMFVFGCFTPTGQLIVTQTHTWLYKHHIILMILLSNFTLIAHIIHFKFHIDGYHPYQLNSCNTKFKVFYLQLHTIQH